jgi:hypothetical protein
MYVTEGAFNSTLNIAVEIMQIHEKFIFFLFCQKTGEIKS